MLRLTPRCSRLTAVVLLFGAVACSKSVLPIVPPTPAEIAPTPVEGPRQAPTPHPALAPTLTSQLSLQEEVRRFFDMVQEVQAAATESARASSAAEQSTLERSTLEEGQ